MLLLTRRGGETIHIGNDIEVTVLGINGNQVKNRNKRAGGCGDSQRELYYRDEEEVIA